MVAINLNSALPTESETRPVPFGHFSNSTISDVSMPGSWFIESANGTAVGIARYGITETAQLQFRNFADNWIQETVGLSSPVDKSANVNFLNIVGMGYDAVGPILHELRDNGGPWFTALQAITKYSPVDRDSLGHYESMRNKWLEWGSQNRYLVD